VNAHDVQESVSRVRDAISVQRVFGEPFEKGGVTVIPAARIAGGGGGGIQNGQGRGADAGFGTGFGMVGRPAGVFVIKGDRVRWQPAVDPAMFAVAFTLLVLGLRRAARRRRRRSRPVQVEWTEGAPAAVGDGKPEPALA
jgi:hypothetical protein